MSSNCKLLFFRCGKKDQGPRIFSSIEEVFTALETCPDMCVEVCISEVTTMEKYRELQTEGKRVRLFTMGKYDDNTSGITDKVRDKALDIAFAIAVKISSAYRTLELRRVARETADAEMARQMRDAEAKQEIADRKLAEQMWDAKAKQEIADRKLAEQMWDAEMKRDTDRRSAAASKEARKRQEEADRKLAMELAGARKRQEEADRKLAMELAEEADEIEEDRTYPVPTYLQAAAGGKPRRPDTHYQGRDIRGVCALADMLKKSAKRKGDM